MISKKIYAILSIFRFAYIVIVFFAFDIPSLGIPSFSIPYNIALSVLFVSFWVEAIVAPHERIMSWSRSGYYMNMFTNRTLAIFATLAIFVIWILWYGTC